MSPTPQEWIIYFLEVPKVVLSTIGIDVRLKSQTLTTLQDAVYWNYV
ncbi:hypothetical protein [Nostoc sp. DSM 114159]